MLTAKQRASALTGPPPLVSLPRTADNKFRPSERRSQCLPRSLARMSVCVWARYRSISPPHPMHEAREGRGEWEREKKITHSTLSSTSLRPNRISASARSLACSSDPYRSPESNLGTDRSRRQERQGVSFVGRPISYHATVFRPSQDRAMKQQKKG